MSRGISYIATLSEHFPCQQALSSFKGVEKPALAVLWGSFGNNYENLLSLVAGLQNPVLEIYLSNEVARRKNDMYSGDLLPGLSVNDYNSALVQKTPEVIQAVSGRVKEILTVLSKITSSIRPVLTLGLEDQFTRSAAKELIKIIRPAWSYELCRNPVHISETSRYFDKQYVDLIELHGDQNTHFPEPACSLYCNDGRGIEFPGGSSVEPAMQPEILAAAVSDFESQGIIPLVWFPEAQGLTGNSGDNPPPARRKIDITDTQVKIVNNILTG